jgi:hypothetical protein
LRAFWGKKKSKVPELKENETLGGSIEKIETLVISNFVGITVDGLPESLLRAFWGKKKSKVLELKENETLGGGGSIEKIEILVVKLKIATNFRGGEQ